ncbi:hypothetical protein [Haloechinothrix salitolerans]|uniref:Uncharacterized protein n=1 Tax=Haloechinothrix salitolerans TaxID=926830 RepID=A0ABW2C1Z6_9PSEU
MPRWIRWFWERYRLPVDTPRESDVATDPAVALSRPPHGGRNTSRARGSETFVGRLSGEDFAGEEQSGAELRRQGKPD